MPASDDNRRGKLVSGIADVAFVRGTLYALLAGAGCSHGLAGTTNGIIRINSDGSSTLIADLSAFQKNHLTASFEPDDFEPDGTWYSMVVAHGQLFAVAPIALNWVWSQLAGVSADLPIFPSRHIVPTAIAYDGHDFFVGNLDTFPIKDGSSKIMKITPAGQLSTVAINFTTVLGLAFDGKGRLYVLENTIGNPGPTPFTGKIVRIDGKNKVTEIATGLLLPTSMTFGPDGNLYVSVFGFAPGLLIWGRAKWSKSMCHSRKQCADGSPDLGLACRRIMKVATIRWDFPQGHADEQSAQRWDKVPGL